jgi:protein SCO1/2
MRLLKSTLAFYLLLLAATSCRQRQKRLPILGEPLITQKDTIYPTIADFSLIDQDSNAVTNHTFDGKIYVADFIFLSCPSICPKMTREMNKVYTRFAGDPRIGLLSHTIDPEHDTVARLSRYTHDLGVATQKWHFVTGNSDSIFTLAKRSYFATAYPDSLDPGNFIHSGGLLLVDKNRHVRGVYDGTDPKETERLMDDMQILLKEQF